MTKGRRTLDFASPKLIRPDVELLLRGHRTVGRWSLAQVLNHCAMTANWSIDGFLTKPAPRVVRMVLGGLAKRSMLGKRRIPEGFPLPKPYHPRPGLDLNAEVAAFGVAIDRVIRHEGPFAKHPLFESMSRDEWRVYHCVHCAHHLSFVIPTDQSNGAHA